ncbi:MAG: winged helix-turn-helix transcriptional regulator [Rhizobiales bacterium]|nr:winged helix-turn-helix transcriptional regulator [Hyphomicrobiales bacterium]MBI3674160.1 winged helix-turn-helix transcriptional regulator [Hyphomicrobiales bacterium]
MTTLMIDRSLAEFEARAGEAVGLLKSLANEKRLMILCKLLDAGEMNVSALGEHAGLSQSALSQHLARMREEEIVDFRRDRQTIFYRVSDRNVGRILKTLKSIYC